MMAGRTLNLCEVRGGVLRSYRLDPRGCHGSGTRERPPCFEVSGLVVNGVPLIGQSSGSDQWFCLWSFSSLHNFM